MDIGTGIFLSSLVFGGLTLFFFTRDRWRWSRIFLRMLLIITGLGILGPSAYYVYKFYESRPKMVEEFRGFRLGEKFSDVVFKNGLPKRSETMEVEDLAKKIVENANKKGTPEFEKVAADYKKAKDAEALAVSKGVDGVYHFNDIRVGIEKNQVEHISYLCSVESTDLTSVNGVSCGQDGVEVLKRFDQEIDILCWKDGLETDVGLKRMYKVPKFGVLFVLHKNSVIAMKISSPEVIRSFVGGHWGKCG